MTARKTEQAPSAAHATTASAGAVPGQPERVATTTDSALLRLQRQIGNQQVAALMRHAAPDAAGAGQVDPVVEGAIEGARSGGRPLHDGVRRQMEGAMGADFSAVRVHCDSRADMLSRALNARAFATGTDIFFREGEYNPGSSAGRELLAHELTHVVQSGGGVRTKLEVSDPGDDAEREADAVAKAVMQQEHASPADANQPPPIAAGGTAPGQVHRFWQEAKEIAGGLLGIPVALPAKPFDGDVGKTPTPASVKGGANAYASLAYDGSDAPQVADKWWPHSEAEVVPPQTIEVERGRKGLVTVHVSTFWHTEGAPDYKGGISDAAVSAHFECDDDGVITVEPAVVMPAGGGGSVVTPFVTGNAAGPSLLASSGVELTQTTNVTGTNSQDRSSGQSNSGGSERGVSVKVGADGKVLSGEAETSNKSTSSQGNERKSGEQRSSSTSLQTAGTNRLKFQRNVRLVAGKPKRLGGGQVKGFAFNSFQVPPDKINHLGQWWQSLDTDLKNSMRRGSVGILFIGHADEPGPPGYNQKLGMQRAHAVEQALKGFAGKDIVSRLESLGSAELTPPEDEDPSAETQKKPEPKTKPKPRPEERRVDFELYRIKK